MQTSDGLAGHNEGLKVLAGSAIRAVSDLDVH